MDNNDILLDKLCGKQALRALVTAIAAANVSREPHPLKESLDAVKEYRAYVTGALGCWTGAGRWC